MKKARRFTPFRQMERENISSIEKVNLPRPPGMQDDAHLFRLWPKCYFQAHTSTSHLPLGQSFNV